MKDYGVVLVAGIGGASLGSEIIKSLNAAGRYRVYGCDISPLAAGHYFPGADKTFIADANDYINSVLSICVEQGIEILIPGGEQPAVLIGKASEKFKDAGVKVAVNSAQVFDICSDKAVFFDFLKKKGIAAPATKRVYSFKDIEDFPCPCIIKPATGTGGSSFVFLAQTSHEAGLYSRYLLDNGQEPIAQEYIDDVEGEYTIGVLNLPDGSIFGSVCLKRIFNVKLSYLHKTPTGVISSGYSQGLIDEFPDICTQAEALAAALGSIGPINVQGRLKNGLLLPFEVNPRFSNSTYLRTMAGFNEIDIYIQYLLQGVKPDFPRIMPGWYLRSLDQVFVPKEKLKAVP